MFDKNLNLGQYPDCDDKVPDEVCISIAIIWPSIALRGVVTIGTSSATRRCVVLELSFVFSEFL